MINAFLISGAPRTLVLDEMIIYYKNLIDYYLQQNITIHFYIILKLDENICDFKAPYERFINNDTKLYFNSSKGLNNFNTILKLLKPIKVICFNKFQLSNIILYSQMKSIDILIKHALEYEKKNVFKYEFFIRSRPDLILLEYPDFKNLKNNVIYTSRKCDAKASDMFFIFNRFMIEIWWNNIVSVMHKEYYLKNYICPEYFIFRNIDCVNSYNSALIRKHTYIQSWYNKAGQQIFLSYINNDNNKENDYKLINKYDIIEYLKTIPIVDYNKII
tara:strand:- start:73 stop:894 length:822 start_codon:yes stop_codon:yes gene_type:complete